MQELEQHPSTIPLSSNVIIMPDDPYERMCVALYAYRLGSVEFLELLADFEKSLELPSPQVESLITPA